MKKIIVVAAIAVVFFIGFKTYGSLLTEKSQKKYNNSQAIDQAPVDENEKMTQEEMMGLMKYMQGTMIEMYDGAAKTLGMTAEELQTELQSGKTFKVIAEEKGVKTEKLGDSMKKEVENYFNQLNDQGKITKIQMEFMMYHLGEKIDSLINSDEAFNSNDLQL
ncbi:MAG: hypothetical protein K0S51_2145 [Bacillales bacterium]|jgi:hypothetical protein|nr:hypothetical protein [Bacillales bacterium]